MISTSLKKRLLLVVAKLLVLGTGGMAGAASLSLTDVPLFLSGNVAPLNMLVLGRDHKLFYEAYADHSDLDGDGTLDIGYRGFDLKPDGVTFKIDYYGYFDSYKCYTHDGSKFVPVSTNTNKRCAGSDDWSGDWLNWVTTTRIDALRKVLYGGKRATDDGSTTVLERAHVPQDAHSWGKEYSSADGYNISDVAPLTAPGTNERHFFANTTLMLNDGDWTGNNEPPVLRVLENQPSTRRIWHWLSKESPVAGGSVNEGAGNVTVTPTNYTVRVQVCISEALKEENCRDYPNGTAQKPTGLLQDFGESDSMLFGLLTGSYAYSKSGGVVRKDVGSIKDEINWQTDGTFTAVNGIIRSMDLFRTPGYEDYTNNAGGRGVFYPPGLVTTRPFNQGEFGGSWGNPVAEMMFEALRYFAQNSAVGTSDDPTGVFNYATGFDVDLGLPKVNTWANPYEVGKPNCAKPFQTVMSDVNTSYDSDQLPGSNWTGLSTDLPGSLNVASLGTTIWNNEFGGSEQHFIGRICWRSTTARPRRRRLVVRQYPRPRARGAHQGRQLLLRERRLSRAITDLNPANGDQKLRTSQSRSRRRCRGSTSRSAGRTVTLVPFAKSVGGRHLGADGTQPYSRPTRSSISTSSRSRRRRADSASTSKTWSRATTTTWTRSRSTSMRSSGQRRQVTVTSAYAAGGIVQHMGYVISGTTHDGIYLVVRDLDTGDRGDVDYFLDTPPHSRPRRRRRAGLPDVCGTPAH